MFKSKIIFNGKEHVLKHALPLSYRKFPNLFTAVLEFKDEVLYLNGKEVLSFIELNEFIANKKEEFLEEGIYTPEDYEFAWLDIKSDIVLEYLADKPEFITEIYNIYTQNK